jgi:hypothetical protein
MKFYIPTRTWPLRIAPYHNLMSKCGFLEGSRETADILLLPGGSDIGNRPDRDLIVVCAYPVVFLNLPFVDRVYRTDNTGRRHGLRYLRRSPNKN